MIFESDDADDRRRRRRVAQPSVYWSDLVIAVLVAMGAGLALGAIFERELLGDHLPFFPAERAEAVDGDTIRVSVLLHLDQLDAAELDRERCPGEKALGLRARDRANELLSAGPTRVKVVGQDAMGRIGAYIVAADRPLGAVLVREGLAQVVHGAGAGRWCPGDASGMPPGTAPAGVTQQMLAWPGLR